MDIEQALTATLPDPTDREAARRSRKPVELRAHSGHVIARRYLLGEPLGRGGMSQVYQARCLRTGDPLAVKVLFRSLIQCSDDVCRLLREAELAGRVNHTGCVQVREAGVTQDGTVYIAMDYVRGRSLAQILARQRALKPRVACRIALEACRVLSAVHDSGIVHCDVKPSNLLIEPGVGRLRLCDFGLATEKGTAAADRDDGIYGTPAYMSPEQILRREVTGRTDLYSLGAVLYECLVGHRPFGGDSFLEIMLQQVRDPVPELPAAVVRQTPRRFVELVRAMLSKDPAMRPPTARTAARVALRALSECIRAEEEQDKNIRQLPAPPPLPVAS